MIVKTLIFILVMIVISYLIAKIRVKFLEKKKKEKLEALEYLSSLDNCIDKDLPWVIYWYIVINKVQARIKNLAWTLLFEIIKPCLKLLQ